MSKRKESALKKARNQIGKVAVDFIAVTLVGGLLLAEKTKQKVLELFEKQKVDKIPVI